MVRTGPFRALVRLVNPKMELYEDVEDSFSWRLVKIELPHYLCPPSASNRSMESRYGFRVNFPICRKGESAASMPRVKVWGARDRPNGRTLY